MLIYFLTYAVAGVFAYFYSLTHKKFLKFFAIMIPVLLATFRGITVGTDTSGYITSVFNISKHAKDFDYLYTNDYCKSIEIVYLVINYYISRFTNNIQVLFFCFHLLFTWLVFSACEDGKKFLNINIAFSYFVFLCLFYNKSFNMLRQSISIAFCMYSLKYIYTDNLKKYLICMLIGAGFHSTIIIFIPMYWYYKYIVNDNNNTLNIICYTILFVIIVSLKYLVSLGISFGIMPERYMVYFGLNQKTVPTIEVAFLLMNLFINILISKYAHNNYDKLIFNFVNISFFLFIAGYIGSYIQRMAYYYSYFLCFSIVNMSKCFKKDNKKIINITTLCVICIYSYMYYSIYRLDQTVPYIMGFN